MGRFARSFVAGAAATVAALGVGPVVPASASPSPAAARSASATAMVSGTAPTFLVGAAVRSIRPTSDAMKTHVGGYGDCDGCGTSGGTTAIRRNDDLDVRAVYISNGHSADVMVSAPFEGWFAGYQQGPRLGITDLRTEAAAALSHAFPTVTAGPTGGVTPGHVIVSTVHCHACPTVVGLWGPTNLTYLRYVYDQTLAVMLDAQRAARPATLTWATGDIGYADDVTVGQANANEGWPIDGQLSVLQARAAGTGRVVATYMDVPVHGNITFGPDLQEMNSEHFGAAARWLEAHVGGIGVVAAGTLGDQTSPMQRDDVRLRGDPRTPYPSANPGNKTGPGYPRAYDDIDRLGALTASTAVEAIAHHGHPVTNDVVGGEDSYQLVPVSNPLILGLTYGHALPNIPLATHDGTIFGQQTADRSIVPPYAVGANIGVWFTVLRVGDVAVASEPGEAFPHVSFAIRQAISGAAVVFNVGNAQDQLGYYYEAWAYPGTLYYSADHYIYNVGFTLAQQNIQGDTLVAHDLGFAVTPTTPLPVDNDYLRYFLKAGVQAWAYPRGPHDLPVDPGTITVPIGVYFNIARGHESGLPTGETNTGPPLVKLDGVTLHTTADKNQITYVTVPCPGDYTLTASLPGTTATWKAIVHVKSATEMTNTTFYPSGTGPHPLAAQNLHDGVGPGCRLTAATAGDVGTPGAGRVSGASGRLPATGGSHGREAIVGLTLGALMWFVAKRHRTAVSTARRGRC